MNSEKLLAAMSGIDSRYITEAQDALGYRTGDKKRASHKTLWRTLLIAAVISALFTAAAAASGWFGISSLKLGTHRDTGRTVISLQGFAGSPENMAISELLEYCGAHPYSYKDSDLSEEDCRGVSYFWPYRVANCATMRQQLEEMIEQQLGSAENVREMAGTI